MHKCMDSHLHIRVTWSGRCHLRSSADWDLVVPVSGTNTLDQRQQAFAISGPYSWNNITVALRGTSLSFHEFCVKLKTKLYRPINWNWTIWVPSWLYELQEVSARWSKSTYTLTYRKDAICFMELLSHHNLWLYHSEQNSPQNQFGQGRSI